MNFDKDRVKDALTKSVSVRVPVWSLLLIIALVPVAVYGAVLFSHTFPGGTAGTNVITSACANSNLFLEFQNNTLTGHKTSQGFACSSSAAAFFVANSYPPTPHYVLPANATLYVIQAPAQIIRDCMGYPSGNGFSGPEPAPDGIPLPLTTGISYDYCVYWSWYPVGGSTVFTVTWSQ